jgi:hypothetical protein
MRVVRLPEVNHMATYEIVLERTPGDSPADVVTGLPPAKCGEVFFPEAISGG